MSTIKVDTLQTRTGSGNITVSNNAVLSGDLTVDTTTLKVDSTNNRVGIGTASPTQDLTIVNSGSARMELMSGTSGTSIIDMTTGEPKITRKIENILSKKGINFVDAPVSGGPKGALNGTIAIMAGCKEDHYEKIKPLLNVISENVFHTGDVGSGHSLKAGNNLLNLICRIATFEVVSLLVKDGIDPNTAVEVIQKSSGRNYATEITLPDNILSGKMFQGFTTGLMNKDATIALNNGELLKTDLPLGQLSKKILQETIEKFGLEADMSNVALTFEEKNDIRLRPNN